MRMIVALMVGAAAAVHEDGEPDPAAVLVSLRRTTARWAQQRLRPRTTSGVAELDVALEGGWPVGKVGEIVGPESSGRTAVAVATVAAATGRGEVAAWIDASDAFDPASVLRCGADLERLLWVRAEGAEQAVRAAELVLETGGVGVVALDLAGTTCTGMTRRWSDSPGGGYGPRVFRPGSDGADLAGSLPGHAQRRPLFGNGGERRNTLGLRLSRAAERAGSVVLVLTERPWSGAQAGVRVTLQRQAVLWGGERDTPRWLVGLAARASFARNGAAGADLRFTWEHVASVVPLSQPAASGLPTSDPGPRSPVSGPRALDPGPRSPVPGCLEA